MYFVCVSIYYYVIFCMWRSIFHYVFLSVFLHFVLLPFVNALLTLFRLCNVFVSIMLSIRRNKRIYLSIYLSTIKEWKSHLISTGCYWLSMFPYTTGSVNSYYYRWRRYVLRRWTGKAIRWRAGVLCQFDRTRSGDEDKPLDVVKINRTKRPFIRIRSFRTFMWTSEMCWFS